MRAREELHEWLAGGSRVLGRPQWVRCVILWIRRKEGAIIIEDTALEMHIVH